MIVLLCLVPGNGVSAISRPTIGCVGLLRRVCVRSLTGNGGVCIAVGLPLAGCEPFPLSIVLLATPVVFQLSANDFLCVGDLVAYAVVLVWGCLPGLIVLCIVSAF